jgi:hypothetical protein
MDNDSSMSKHDLIGGILFYSDGDEVIASLANADKRGLCSGKLLSRRDLHDAVKLMDVKDQARAITEPCWFSDRAGDILHLTTRDAIWYTPTMNRTIHWPKGEAVYRFPMLVWRWYWETRNLSVAAVDAATLGTRPYFDTKLYRLKMPNMSGYSVHACGMDIGADTNPWHSSEAYTEVEDSFFGSRFSSEPLITTEKKGVRSCIMFDGRVRLSDEPEGTLDEFYYATYR